MKKAIGFALAVLATSVVAASAQGGQKVAAGGTLASAGYSCKKTITLPLVTPVTGGAGFLGAEQGSWAKYAVKTLAPKLGLKVKFVLGDTPVEQGPAPAQALGARDSGTGISPARRCIAGIATWLTPPTSTTNAASSSAGP